MNNCPHCGEELPEPIKEHAQVLALTASIDFTVKSLREIADVLERLAKRNLN